MEPVAIRPGQRSIWHGPSLFVLDAWGAADETGAPGGFYFRETRFLNRLRLELNGSQPWPCAIGRAAAGEILIGLAFPELLEWSGGGSGVAGDRVPRDARGIPWRALDLMLRFRLRFHRLEARLAITNRTRDPVDIEVGWRLDADFADLLEAGEAPRTPRAPVERSWPILNRIRAGSPLPRRLLRLSRSHLPPGLTEMHLQSHLEGVERVTATFRDPEARHAEPVSLTPDPFVIRV